MHSYFSDLLRLITNLIRTGVITQVDKENALCRVRTGNLETNWINWLTLRAGNSRTWWKPSVGEQVLLLSIGGNLETAFALPAIYSNTNPPPAESEEGCITTFPDGGWFEYEPASGTLLIKGIKRLRLEAADQIELQTKQLIVSADSTCITSDTIITGATLLNGETIINGGVTQGGGVMSSNGVIADAHIHDGVTAGKAKTGGPQ